MVAEVEEIADAIGTVALDEAERSASNATNLDTLRASARRIRIFAIAATVLVTSQKTVSRLVGSESHAHRHAEVETDWSDWAHSFYPVAQPFFSQLGGSDRSNRIFSLAELTQKELSHRVKRMHLLLLFSTGTGVELLQLQQDWSHGAQLPGGRQRFRPLCDAELL